MCQVFGVSRSGYYNWVQHEPSDRKQSDERLKLEIKVAHIRTRETYGTLQLDSMKSESLVIVDQNATVNTFPGLVHTARHTMGVGCKRSR